MNPRALVIGAGAIGCLSALALAARGWQVTLTDRGALGAESSWAGGGILFPLLPWQYINAVNRLALAGAARHAELCATLRQDTGMDPQYEVSGMLALGAFDSTGALDWCRTHGIAAVAHKRGLWLPDVAQIRNPRLLQALRLVLPARGIKLLENTELVPDGVTNHRISAWRDRNGTLFQAEAYVLTVGAWSRQLLGHHALGLEIRPIRGQMLLYRIKPGTLNHIIYRDGTYLIPRRDGHILVGSTVENAGFDKSTTPQAAAMLAAGAAELLPELATTPVMQHWSGLRPGSPGNVPVIARHPTLENLYLNSGHFRYGVTMAPASAELLANLMCDKQAADPDYAYPEKSPSKPWNMESTYS